MERLREDSRLCSAHLAQSQLTGTQQQATYWSEIFPLMVSVHHSNWSNGQTFSILGFQHIGYICMCIVSLLYYCLIFYLEFLQYSLPYCIFKLFCFFQYLLLIYCLVGSHRDTTVWDFHLIHHSYYKTTYKRVNLFHSHS